MDVVVKGKESVGGAANDDGLCWADLEEEGGRQPWHLRDVADISCYTCHIGKSN